MTKNELVLVKIDLNYSVIVFIVVYCVGKTCLYLRV